MPNQQSTIIDQPTRIQRKRTKGWTMPENTIYVGRGSAWGNPFKLQGDMIYLDCSHRRKIMDPWVYLCMGDIKLVVILYRRLIHGAMAERMISLDLKASDPTEWTLEKAAENVNDLLHWRHRFETLDITDLTGKNLACWCPLDQPCHADVLLKFANPKKEAG